MDYSLLCSVVIKVEQHGREDSVVYERPQSKSDPKLTAEAHAIFADMKSRGRLAPDAHLLAIGVARNHGQASEMGVLNERTKMD